MASAARELRYHSRSAVNGDLAYDLEWELRERELRHAGEAPRREDISVPGTRTKVRSVSKVQTRERQKVSIFSVLGFAAVLGLAVLVLMSYVELMQVSADTVTLKAQLEELETQNVTLTAQYERMFDLASVKEAAQAAGMSKPSASQIYYIDLSGGDSAVVYQQEEPSALSRLLTSMRQGIYTVVEYFD